MVERVSLSSSEASSASSKAVVDDQCGGGMEKLDAEGRVEPSPHGWLWARGGWPWAARVPVVAPGSSMLALQRGSRNSVDSSRSSSCVLPSLPPVEGCWRSGESGVEMPGGGAGTEGTDAGADGEGAPAAVTERASGVAGAPSVWTEASVPRETAEEGTARRGDGPAEGERRGEVAMEEKRPAGDS